MLAQQELNDRVAMCVEIGVDLVRKILASYFRKFSILLTYAKEREGAFNI
jgi:hypothetical protein